MHSMLAPDAAMGDCLDRDHAGAHLSVNEKTAPTPTVLATRTREVLSPCVGDRADQPGATR